MPPPTRAPFSPPLQRPQIVANLPVPLWLAPARAAAGAPMLFPLNLKWAVRRAAAVLAAAMVLYCAWSYRDLERESYK